jgi:hypothetical protein
MDIRAFGSVYGQTSALPYASGFVWKPSDGPKKFPACRAIYIQNAGGTNKAIGVEFADAQGQICYNQFLNGDFLCPISVTQLSGGNVSQAVVLY